MQAQQQRRKDRVVVHAVEIVAADVAERRARRRAGRRQAARRGGAARSSRRETGLRTGRCGRCPTARACRAAGGSAGSDSTPSSSGRPASSCTRGRTRSCARCAARRCASARTARSAARTRARTAPARRASDTNTNPSNIATSRLDAAGSRRARSPATSAIVRAASSVPSSAYVQAWYGHWIEPAKRPDGCVHKPRAAMAADVVERAHALVRAARDDEALARDLRRHEVARALELLASARRRSSRARRSAPAPARTPRARGTSARRARALRRRPAA